MPTKFSFTVKDNSCSRLECINSHKLKARLTYEFGQFHRRVSGVIRNVDRSVEKIVGIHRRCPPCKPLPLSPDGRDVAIRFYGCNTSFEHRRSSERSQ